MVRRCRPSEEIAQLKKERDEFRDQALRARAEFANYQKRAKQQADADRVYAVGSLARDLLDPLDNLEPRHRRPACLRGRGGHRRARHGPEAIARGPGQAWRRADPGPGFPFDPNLHDAVLQQPSLEHPEGTVVAELSKGYKIRDRVLRPSKVAVSVRPPAD